jgi:hypothetical protein
LRALQAQNCFDSVSPLPGFFGCFLRRRKAANQKIKEVFNHGKTRLRVNDPRSANEKPQRKYFEIPVDALGHLDS